MVAALHADLFGRTSLPSRILAGSSVWEAVYDELKRAEERTGKWMRCTHPEHPGSLLFMGVPVVLCEMMAPDEWMSDPTTQQTRRG